MNIVNGVIDTGKKLISGGSNWIIQQLTDVPSDQIEAITEYVDFLHEEKQTRGSGSQLISGVLRFMTGNLIHSREYTPCVWKVNKPLVFLEQDEFDRLSLANKAKYLITQFLRILYVPKAVLIFRDKEYMQHLINAIKKLKSPFRFQVKPGPNGLIGLIIVKKNIPELFEPVEDLNTYQYYGIIIREYTYGRRSQAIMTDKTYSEKLANLDSDIWFYFNDRPK
jgi:hypothetical protein